MYQVREFEETRGAVLHRLIGEHPLGAIVLQGAGGLEANHIPFEIDAEADAPHGILRAHVARANPLWRQAGAEVLVLFQGPSAYVTPSLYEEKAVSGKVVPTYNYAAVHVHGRLRAIEDPAWILAMLERQSAHHEAAQDRPWVPADAPREFIDKLLKAIVGIEIRIARIEGKWKMSQNRSATDQANVEAAMPPAVAHLMRERRLP